MASTKAKTALATAAITFLGATLLTMKAIQAARAAHVTALHDIQGTWEGNLIRGGIGLNRSLPERDRMVLRLSKNNGDYAATADLIDWGYRNVPVAVDYNYPSLHLSINPQAMFDGKVNTNGTQLNFVGFTLERTNAPDTAPEALTEAAFTPRAGSDL